MLVARCAEAIIFSRGSSRLTSWVEQVRNRVLSFPNRATALSKNADLTTFSPQVKTMQFLKWLRVKQDREWMSDLLVRRREGETTRSSSSLNDSVYVVLSIPGMSLISSRIVFGLWCFHANIDIDIPADMIIISIPDSDYGTCGLYFFYSTNCGTC